MTAVVYFIRPVGKLGPVKIGYTTDVEARLRRHLSWSPVPLEIAATIDVAVPGQRAAMLLERQFHLKHAAAWLHQEWFAATDDLLSDIEAIISGNFDLASLPEPKWVGRKGGGKYSRPQDQVAGRSAGTCVPPMPNKLAMLGPRSGLSSNVGRALALSAIGYGSGSPRREPQIPARFYPCPPGC